MLALMASVLFRTQSGKLGASGRRCPVLSPPPLVTYSLFCALLVLSVGALADDLDLSSAPPYFVPSVEPNLIVSVESSGTMHSGRLPWDLPTDEYFRVTPMATASEVNTLYYDPQINYLPAIGADGDQMAHGDFTAAKRSVFIGGSCTLDLSQNYEAVLIEEEPRICDELTRPTDSSRLDSVYAHNTRNPGYGSYAGNTDLNAWPYGCLYGGESCAAYYNVFNNDLCPSTDLSTLDNLDATSGDYEDNLAGFSACFVTFYVGSDIASGEPGYLSTDELEQRRALLQEEDESGLSAQVLAKRNFANWYVYHRTVGRGAKTALSRAMDGLGSNVRVTYQSVSEAYPPDTYDLDTKLKAFSGDGRTDFYDWLFRLNPDATAEAKHVSAMLNAGELPGMLSAYRTDPDPDASQEEGVNPSLSCRNNLHLLVAASPWVERILSGGASAAGCFEVVTPPDWLSNNDGASITLPDTTSYDARAPYGDGNTGMLADIAFHYWATDLIDLTDDVPALISDASGTDAEIYWNPANDPADWQHLTTFSVGMDLRGSVPFDRDAFFEGGDYAAGSSIGTDGFPGTINSIGHCSVEWNAYWDPGYPELNLDDIWHAGLDGRGGYSNATNASDLLTALTAVTDRVADAAGSSSTSADGISTGVLFSGDMVYQSVMSSSNWHGDLRIIQISHGLGQPPCPLKGLGELCQDVAAGQEPYRSAAEEVADQDWDAGRTILTRSDTQEFAFRSGNWALLTDQQQDHLQTTVETDAGDIDTPKDRIDYLRGDRSNEGTFRVRDSLIGDIIGSTPPVLVGAPYRFYQDHGYLVAEEVDGTSFRDTHADRTEVVYVGANDGMLHAFDADLGTELFAYVPRMVFDGLADLTMPGYGSDPPHRNFVDGPIAEGDAYFGGAWHTVLAVSAGLGAQGLFALDVTNPDGVVEQTVALDNAARLSLWELTDAENADIGYVIGQPSIVRICPGMDDDPCGADPVANAQWVVGFGNGYNNAEDDDHRSPLCENSYLCGTTTLCDPDADDYDPDACGPAPLCGEAMLFVNDVADGSEVARYATGKGHLDDPLREQTECAIGRANALAQPTVADYDGDLVADAAYAGDLFGNLWRFDLTDTSSDPELLFTTADPSMAGDEQPITTPPAVLRHPLGIGVLVIFGTGKLLEGSDISDNQVQTVYAIWDDIDAQGVRYCSNPPADLLTRSELLQQHLIVSDLRVGTVSNARVVSNNSVDWGIDQENQECNGHWGWYLDLVPTTVSGDTVTQVIDGSAKERIIGAPELDSNRLKFATLTPSTDRCSAGGLGWVNMIDARDGSRLDAATFDLDLDGSIGTSDLLDVPPDGGDPAPASSMQLVTAGSEAKGIYTSPASLALEAGKEIKGLTTGEGSPTADEIFKKWRVWRQIK